MTNDANPTDALVWIIYLDSYLIDLPAEPKPVEYVFELAECDND